MLWEDDEKWPHFRMSHFLGSQLNRNLFIEWLSHKLNRIFSVSISAKSPLIILIKTLNSQSSKNTSIYTFGDLPNVYHNNVNRTCASSIDWRHQRIQLHTQKPAYSIKTAIRLKPSSTHLNAIMNPLIKYTYVSWKWTFFHVC